MQNNYYTAKEGDGGGAFDMKKYQPIHGDKYRATGTDEYQMLAKPEGEVEERALAQADYQTRLRVERANQYKNQASIDPTMVDKSHKGATKPSSNQKFDSDIISPNLMREAD